MIKFYEIDHPLSNEDDKEVPCAQTYTNNNLLQPGGSSTHGSWYETWSYGTILLGEIVPPLYKFDLGV